MMASTLSHNATMKPPPIDVLPFSHAYELAEDGKIIYKGQVVQRAFKLDVVEADCLTVEVVRRTAFPEQVMHLFSEHCRIRIRRSISSHGLLWFSQWKDPIEIEFVDVKPGARFVMWNAVARAIGQPTNDSWGNFGAIIEEKQADREWILRCCQSALESPPDFTALVLHVTKTTKSDS